MGMFSRKGATQRSQPQVCTGMTVTEKHTLNLRAVTYRWIIGPHRSRISLHEEHTIYGLDIGFGRCGSPPLTNLFAGTNS